MENDLLNWYQLVGILVGFVGLFKAYFYVRDRTLERKFATKEELKMAVDERDERFDKLDKDLVDITTTLKNAPSKEDIHNLYIELKEVKGELGAVDVALAGTKELLAATNSALDRLYENELSKGNKS